ncbi:MAG TPA: EamA family transporter RarD [Myxococcota bacterium]|nr:EamA family transporter RarD [Myxococcota bacterium]
MNLRAPEPIAGSDPANLRIGGARPHGSGVGFALAAHTLWGFLPAFWKLFGAVSPLEVLANRVLWSLLFTLALLAALGRLEELRTALRSPRERSGLAAASVFIALNWGIFIWAVQANRIVETSLGYFLNPLINAALGVALFRERLAPAQLVALALATLGVGAQVVAYGGVPWVALALGATFSCYGVAKKRTAVPALTSLAFETAVLGPLALGFLAFGTAAAGGALADGPAATRALLLVSGPLTAAPLIFFAAAARRLPFTVLGLIQYLSPTLSLLLAVLVYGEPFTRVHAFSFACIWAALALFSASTWQLRRALSAP